MTTGALEGQQQENPQKGKDFLQLVATDNSSFLIPQFFFPSVSERTQFILDYINKNRNKAAIVTWDTFNNPEEEILAEQIQTILNTQIYL